MQYRTKLGLVLALGAGTTVVSLGMSAASAVPQALRIADPNTSIATGLWDDALIAILTALCMVIGCQGVPAASPTVPVTEVEAKVSEVIQAYASNGLLETVNATQAEEALKNVDLALTLLEEPPATLDASLRAELEATLLSLRADLVERLEE